MPDKICGTCKHRGENLKLWDNDTHDEAESKFFLCGKVVHGHLATFFDDEREEIMRRTAFTEDASDCKSRLCVSDDFGCNLWEPKPHE